MRGRPATSNQLKKLKGTDQPCRMREEVSAEPITERFVTAPKKSPLKTSRAKKIFVAKANQMIALGTLTELDLELLISYSYLIDELYTLMENVAANGRYEKRYNDKGVFIGSFPTPDYLQIKPTMEAVNKMGAELGFSPISRQKLRLERPDKSDPFTDLIKNL